MAASKTIVVAAGGTGGHLFPAEALARELEARGWSVVLATDARGAEYAQAFPASERLALNAATFKTTDPIGAVRGGLKIAQGVMQARKAFRRLNPAAVVGFGGYPSLPALLAAISQKRPTIIHEQNAVLGRVNRALAKRVSAVACAFPTLAKSPAGLKVEVVGNPVRPDIRALYDHVYQAPTDRIRLLVTGGSQGARLLSETVPQAVARLAQPIRAKLYVQQQTRPETLDTARQVYAEAGVEAEVAPFFRDMAGRLRTAHLMVGRAGASTVCELAVAGLPSVLVPLKIAMDDHQRFNAKLLTDAGAADVVLEDDLDADGLATLLQGLLEKPETLAGMAKAAHAAAAPDAAKALADLVEKTADA
ncbi:MAG TPA: undecaprenyldiphospho-muramoylpentapeptide beta-N-acetylglucosaminyltransferase [Caulobacteraceae bacterium]|jgi:UDP-N-acetylglucosamine--N-acetylmuramyl-(pentapeptide) pyrophosphoryl-undecaprenol N-acetylglucosamine transferase|nr:undecaprenyldiphospho-muramoylpentapeptide beta-N-acetylglucosaminyltransferase [Caulobacteraceae bacterium]